MTPTTMLPVVPLCERPPDEFVSAPLKCRIRQALLGGMGVPGCSRRPALASCNEFVADSSPVCGLARRRCRTADRLGG